MALFSIFARKKAPSANLAKERLKIIVEHSRANAKRPEFLNKIRCEILAVVNKYVEIDIEDINTSIANQGDSEVLELNILLPDTVGIEAAQVSEEKKSSEQAKNGGHPDKTK